MAGPTRGNSQDLPGVSSGLAMPPGDMLAGWGREALSRRDKSLLNLVMLGTLGRNAEFKLHLKGALTNGCTREEIKDTLIQLAIYAGIPAGVEAFRLAREVLTDIDANT